MTLVELLTGKKPFKKKFQKYKTTEDKVKICAAGKVEDEIEEKNVEAKLGAAKGEDDDGRDSADEETDEEEAEEAAKVAQKRGSTGRRSSIRVIGGFDKTVESLVETEAAVELLASCLESNPRLQPFAELESGDGLERLVRVASVVPFDGEVELFRSGEAATFFALVLEGTFKDASSGEAHGAGSIIGYEGLFQDNYHRASAVAGGVAGGVVAIFLYGEMGRAQLFDGETVGLVKDLLLEVSGGDLERMEGFITDFGDAEDNHEEEGFLHAQKKTKNAEDAAAKAAREKELSASKQRDQKIYLTQEVWAKRDLLSRDAVKFLNGLLTRDVNKRLGCGPGGLQAIKEHDFFADIDWDRLEEGNLPAPYIPKKEVNAKDEAKMKTFNTAGMKKLQKEDQEKWSEWDWTSAPYYQTEMASYWYEHWSRHEYKKGKGGGGGAGGGGCCEVS